MLSMGTGQIFYTELKMVKLDHQKCLQIVLGK